MSPNTDRPRPRAGRAARPHPAGCFVSGRDSLTAVVGGTMNGRASGVNGRTSPGSNPVQTLFGQRVIKQAQRKLSEAEPSSVPVWTPGRLRFDLGSVGPMALHLTYAELAERIGRSEPAAKSLAKRKRWRRSIGNDGLTRITIDEPELDELADPDRRSVGRPPANSNRASLTSEPSSILVQTALVDLQAKLAVAEALAGERKDALDVERAKAEHLVGEVADLARQLARITEEASNRERDLQSRVASADTALAVSRSELASLQMRTEADIIQVRNELKTWKTLPWWKRLVG